MKEEAEGADWTAMRSSSLTWTAAIGSFRVHYPLVVSQADSCFTIRPLDLLPPTPAGPVRDGKAAWPAAAARKLSSERRKGRRERERTAKCSLTLPHEAL